jgi:hypothetical protein
LKKKLLISLTLITCIALCAGCGKKKASVADNLIKDDPTKVEGLEQYADMPGVTTDSVIEEPTVSENSMDVSGNEAVSDNAIDVSENSVSADSVSADSVSEDTVSSDKAELEDLGASVYTPKENNELTIANLSGRRIDAVYVTFSAGNLKGSEILGKKKLADGGTYTYKISDMQSLREAGVIKLSITVIDKHEKDINFGEIEIVDPNNMTIVLAHEGKNYYMYQY